jgi:hypothetical protein
MNPLVVFDCEKVQPNRFALALAAAARSIHCSWVQAGLSPFTDELLRPLHRGRSRLASDPRLTTENMHDSR